MTSSPRASGPGSNGPLVLSVELDGANVDDLAPLEAALATDAGVQAVSPIQPNDGGTAAVLRVVPTSAPQDEATTDLVHRLRDDVIPEALADAPGAQVHVGGQTAMFIDMSDRISDRLVWSIGAVILLSVLLLTMVFRSVAVPSRRLTGHASDTTSSTDATVPSSARTWFHAVHCRRYVRQYDAPSSLAGSTASRRSFIGTFTTIVSTNTPTT
jgi:uncharacterized membrane protein YdfJ with MMPL/SSD domain